MLTKEGGLSVCDVNVMEEQGAIARERAYRRGDVMDVTFGTRERENKFTACPCMA